MACALPCALPVLLLGIATMVEKDSDDASMDRILSSIRSIVEEDGNRNKKDNANADSELSSGPSTGGDLPIVELTRKIDKNGQITPLPLLSDAEKQADKQEDAPPFDQQQVERQVDEIAVPMIRQWVADNMPQIGARIAKEHMDTQSLTGDAPPAGAPANAPASAPANEGMRGASEGTVVPGPDTPFIQPVSPSIGTPSPSIGAPSIGAPLPPGGMPIDKAGDAPPAGAPASAPANAPVSEGMRSASEGTVVPGPDTPFIQPASPSIGAPSIGAPLPPGGMPIDKAGDAPPAGAPASAPASAPANAPASEDMRGAGEGTVVPGPDTPFIQPASPSIGAESPSGPGRVDPDSDQNDSDQNDSGDLDGKKADGDQSDGSRTGINPTPGDKTSG